MGLSKSEVLFNTPGVDPFEDTSAAEAADMPASGWFLDAGIRVGLCGAMQLYRYAEAAFEEGGRSMTLVGSEPYAIAYENPYYNFKDVEPCLREGQEHWLGLDFDELDITPLDNGGRLLDQSAPMGFNARPIRIVPGGFKRAVSSREELGAVLVNAAVGMSLEGNDIRALITTVANKTKHLN
ncbi:hypothetical protein F4X86_00190 [Candidatus Saccharibacteria bacterium]|nr:hypothetical protein [Candidatus Saccharibacteria bacterium]